MDPILVDDDDGGALQSGHQHVAGPPPLMPQGGVFASLLFPEHERRDLSALDGELFVTQEEHEQPRELDADVIDLSALQSPNHDAGPSSHIRHQDHVSPIDSGIPYQDISTKRDGPTANEQPRPKRIKTDPEIEQDEEMMALQHLRRVAAPSPLPMEIENDNPPPQTATAPAVSPDVPIDSVETAMPAEARNGEFGWNSYRGETDAERLLIKEAAVRSALEATEQLSTRLTTAFSQLRQPISQAELDAYGVEDMRKWMAEAATLREQLLGLPSKSTSSSAILVGVAGNTGSGKTSLLNALLGLKDFLPTSQHQASTAVACQISWYHDAVPGRMFRADVSFQPRDEFTDEYEEYREALQLRAIMGAATDPELTEGERREAQAEQDAIVRVHASKFNQLFTLSDDEIIGTDAEQLLQRNPQIDQLLGVERRLEDATAEGLSRTIKPYLDSTGTVEVLDGGRRRLSIWSIIKSVHVYLRADILRGGISLVDLPGLGDAVESRAAVARRFYDRLDVQIVASPIVRAADEETTSQLVSRHQEISMRMAGRFTGGGFCIVLSKTDDLDAEAFARGCKEFRDDEAARTAHEDRKELRKEVKKLVREAVKIRKKIGRETKAEAKRRQRLRPGASLPQSKIPGLHRLAVECDDEKVTMERKLAYEEGRFTFQCLRARNRLAVRRVQADLIKRHKALLKLQCDDDDDNGGNDEYEENRDSDDDEAASISEKNVPGVPLLAASAKAFWAARRGAKLEGFPDEVYSGVPALRHWIVFKATAKKREEQLDTALAAYQRLLLGIEQWSNTRNLEGLGMGSSKAGIEQGLRRIHEKYRKKLANELNGYHGDMAKFDPFTKHTDLLHRWAGEREAIIDRWPLRDPENRDRDNTKLMAWTTFNAILKRSGMTFRASYGASYNWIEGLMVPLMELLYEDWDRVFSFELVQMEHPLNKAVRAVWNAYTREMLDYCCASMPPAMAAGAEASINGINNIQEELCFRSRDVIRKLKEDALSAKDMIMETVHSYMQPIFTKCLQMTGPGHYRARRMYLLVKTKTGSLRFMNHAWKRMENMVGRAKEDAGVLLARIAPFGVDSSERVLAIFLNRAFQTTGAEDRRAALQQDAAAIRREWHEKWREGALAEEEIAWARDRDVPSEYISLEAFVKAEEDGGEDEDEEKDDDSSDGTVGKGDDSDVSEEE